MQSKINFKTKLLLPFFLICMLLMSQTKAASSYNQMQSGTMPTISSAQTINFLPHGLLYIAEHSSTELQIIVRVISNIQQLVIRYGTSNSNPQDVWIIDDLNAASPRIGDARQPDGTNQGWTLDDTSNDLTNGVFATVSGAKQFAFRRKKQISGAASADNDFDLSSATYTMQVYVSTNAGQTQLSAMTKVRDLSMTFATTGGDLETNTNGDLAGLSSPKGESLLYTNEEVMSYQFLNNAGTIVTDNTATKCRMIIKCASQQCALVFNYGSGAAGKDWKGFRVINPTNTFRTIQLIDAYQANGAQLDLTSSLDTVNDLSLLGFKVEASLVTVKIEFPITATTNQDANLPDKVYDLSVAKNTAASLDFSTSSTFNVYVVDFSRNIQGLPSVTSSTITNDASQHFRMNNYGLLSLKSVSSGAAIQAIVEVTDTKIKQVVIQIGGSNSPRDIWLLTGFGTSPRAYDLNNDGSSNTLVVDAGSQDLSAITVDSSKKIISFQRTRVLNPAIAADGDNTISVSAAISVQVFVSTTPENRQINLMTKVIDKSIKFSGLAADGEGVDSIFGEINKFSAPYGNFLFGQIYADFQYQNNNNVAVTDNTISKCVLRIEFPSSWNTFAFSHSVSSGTRDFRGFIVTNTPLILLIATDTSSSSDSDVNLSTPDPSIDVKVLGYQRIGLKTIIKYEFPTARVDDSPKDLPVTFGNVQVSYAKSTQRSFSNMGAAIVKNNVDMSSAAKEVASISSNSLSNSMAQHIRIGPHGYFSIQTASDHVLIYNSITDLTIKEVAIVIGAASSPRDVWLLTDLGASMPQVLDFNNDGTSNSIFADNLKNDIQDVTYLASNKYQIQFRRNLISSGASTASDGDIQLSSSASIPIQIYVSQEVGNKDLSKMMKVVDKSIKFSGLSADRIFSKRINTD